MQQAPAGTALRLRGSVGPFSGCRLPQPQLSSPPPPPLQPALAPSSPHPPPARQARPLPSSFSGAAWSRREPGEKLPLSAMPAHSRPLSSSPQANMASAEPRQGTRQGRDGAPHPSSRRHALPPRGTMGLVGGREAWHGGAAPPRLSATVARAEGHPKPCRFMDEMASLRFTGESMTSVRSGG